jgi:ketosteroid isomerase-like protein
MKEHPNAELLRRGYAAFGAGDMQTVGDVLADDVVGHAPGNNSLSGDYKGKAQVFDYFTKFAQFHEGTYRFKIHDMFANDQHCVLLVEEEWQRPKRFKNRSVHIWHLRDGRAAEFWFFNEDQAAVDASFQA